MSIKRATFIFAICAAALAPLYHATPAHAQNTFVSGLGDDANPCTRRSSPCQTFAGALPQTAPGGIITCLDPVTSGSITITKPVTIDCTATSASIVVTRGGTAIRVTALKSTDVVNLRGLVIDGLGTGNVGVSVTAPGAVNIEHCKIAGFQGVGIGLEPDSGTLKAIVSHTHIYNNGVGIVMNAVTAPADMLVRDAIVDQNANHAILIVTTTNHAGALIERSTLAFNATQQNGAGVAILGQPSGPATGALVYLGSSTIVGNQFGVTNSGGTFQSFKINQIAGNVTDGTPITAFPGPGGTPLQ